jgi:hypothetical protein
MLDLDDFCAEVGHQLGRIREGLHLLGREDPDAVERFPPGLSFRVSDLADSHGVSAGLGVGWKPLVWGGRARSYTLRRRGPNRELRRAIGEGIHVRFELTEEELQFEREVELDLPKNF